MAEAIVGYPTRGQAPEISATRLNLIDGRSGLLRELESAPDELRTYIAKQLQKLSG